MNIRLEEARIRADELRRNLAKKQEKRDAAKAEVEAAREELEILENRRATAEAEEAELTSRVRNTKDGTETLEANALKATTAEQAARAAYDEAAEILKAATERLRQEEETRDEAERALAEAQQMLIEAGELERSSRGQLDARIQRAMDAQRTLDQVTFEAQDAQERVDNAERALSRAREAQAELPVDDEVLRRQERQKHVDLAEAIQEARSASDKLVIERQRLERAESEARDAKQAYETAQERLRSAIEAADKADEQRVDEDGSSSTEGIYAYVAATDLRSRAMQTNAQALTALADADVRCIRIRISRDATVRALDAANAKKARAEREIKECAEAIENAQSLRDSSVAEVTRLKAELDAARTDQERLDSQLRQATADNTEAQRGLREVQDTAIRTGQANRSAASVLDMRTHALSVAVGAVEMVRAEASEAKNRMRECESRLHEATKAEEDAKAAVEDAKAFSDDADYRIAEQRSIAAEAQRERIQVAARLKDAEERLYTLQREFDIVQSDLTDAEVAVIMAEIGG